MVRVRTFFSLWLPTGSPFYRSSKRQQPSTKHRRVVPHTTPIQSPQRISYYRTLNCNGRCHGNHHCHGNHTSPRWIQTKRAKCALWIIAIVLLCFLRILQVDWWAGQPRKTRSRQQRNRGAGGYGCCSMPTSLHFTILLLPFFVILTNVTACHDWSVGGAYRALVG